jgi:hypothetical protein
MQAGGWPRMNNRPAHTTKDTKCSLSQQWLRPLKTYTLAEGCGSARLACLHATDQMQPVVQLRSPITALSSSSQAAQHQHSMPRTKTACAHSFCVWSCAHAAEAIDCSPSRATNGNQAGARCHDAPTVRSHHTQVWQRCRTSHAQQAPASRRGAPVPMSYHSLCCHAC